MDETKFNNLKTKLSDAVANAIVTVMQNEATSSTHLELPESADNQKELAKELLEKCCPAVYDFIIEWLDGNTQHLESNGYVKESNIDKWYIQDNYPDTYQEIKDEALSDIDVDSLDSDKLEEAARRWMSEADCVSIISMIKDEA